MKSRLPRRLLVWFIALLGIGLLAIFMVCFALQIQTPWQTVSFPSLKHIRFYNLRNDTNISSEYQLSAENELDINKEPDQSAEQELDHQDESEDTEKTKPVTPDQNTNTLQRTEPKNETKILKPKMTPQFDFGEQYFVDEFPSQTDCPNNIRKHVPQTKFSEMFLHTIPVLQWAKHLTPDEYERLSRYGGAHGWGGVTLDELKSSLGIMNTTANRLMFDDWEKRINRSACIRCAAVGNGGILNGSKKGKEIDEHDYVFRVNGAVLKGFEEDVGSRTSFYTFSTNTMRNSMRSYRGVGYRGPPISEVNKIYFLPDHNRDYILMTAAATHTVIEKGPERSKNPPKYFGEDVTVEKFKIYHPDFTRYLRNRFLHSGLLRTGAKRFYRPSTGAVMLLAAIHTCDQVDAYGFMTPDWKLYSDHYYDKYYKTVRFFANHDMRMEMRLWQELHQAGLMNLFMRQ
ncbi:alpha-N-acetylgalactosaminide alpha-2,6-sialyltransferase 2 [Triplophysa dalaica]|uniref:alpha-N-acetylgalactosaminide alpha-2,6-sialyltransferase 2 n=1 Tax=Triplophysa dalaica TaxID=1582913 RepID=UPI0024DFF6D8|nr:alpha-N-acetylgalactosaminide alpha-2,6-sialyltransferase 2 [Triplophysa dalaica]